MNEEEVEKRLLVEFFGGRTAGVFVEVGANHPRHGSQTWAFEQRGWTGVLVEPQAEFHDLLVAQRPRSKVIRAACTSPAKVGRLTLHVPADRGFASTEKNVDDHGVQYVREETVPALTLDTVLEENGIAGKVDFVSLDVEGTELDVLAGFLLAKHQPDLIVVEDKLIHLRKHRYLRRQGYRLLRRTCMNNWYVPAAANVPPAPFPERLRLLRKMFLGLGFRKLRHWRHNRR